MAFEFVGAAGSGCPGIEIRERIMEKLESQVRSTRNTAGERASQAEVSSPADPASAASLGLPVTAVFCPVDVRPLDTVEETRQPRSRGEREVVFEQNDCETPSSWSQLAANVVVSSTFRRGGHSAAETSVRQLILRDADDRRLGPTDNTSSEEDGERFYRGDLCACINTPRSIAVWFNVGLYHQYGIKATCAIGTGMRRRAGDPAEELEYPRGRPASSRAWTTWKTSELARSEAMLFKFGSGTGTDLSTLRSQREKLSGGGKPSGPLSFMRVYDQIAAVVKSGGKTRRAAKMQSLKVWHPDILEFIECKQREEEKARILLAKGYNYEDAYSSVLFQNANLSIRVSDEFMAAAEAASLDDPLGDGPRG